MPEETLESMLREAASRCTRPKYKMSLLSAADILRLAIKRFGKSPTASNMIELNGAWVHGVRIFGGRPTEASPLPPLAEVQRLAA